MTKGNQQRRTPAVFSLKPVNVTRYPKHEARSSEEGKHGNTAVTHVLGVLTRQLRGPFGFPAEAQNTSTCPVRNI